MQKIKLLVILVLVGILIGTGCGSSAPAASSGLSVGQSVNKSNFIDPVADGANEKSSSDTAPASASIPVGNDNGRMVIRNGDMVIVVKDVASSVDAIAKIAGDIAGYVGQSSVRHEGERIVGEISIQVPADKFNEAMSAIRGLAVKIDSDKTTTQDVTDEFVDNEARLKNLKVSEDATQKLMDRADSMDKVLAIQRELTTIRGEIEKIQGRQNYLKRRVDVSTIKVQLTTEAGPAPEVTAKARSGFEPGTTARVAWETSLNILSGLATVLITLVVVLWWVIPIILFVWWLVRRHRREAKARALALAAQATDLPAVTITGADHPEERPRANPA